MEHPRVTIITAAWILFAVVWLAMARSVKPTERVESFGSRAAHLVPLALCFFLLTTDLGSPLTFLNERVFSWHPLIADAGTVLCPLGVLFAVWARLTLGRNWSASVMQKTGHELIQRGPFRYVRHPIYTGMLCALLGTALAVGEWRGVLAWLLAYFSLWRKYRLEERFMQQLFGTSYERYRQQVPALVPFSPLR